MLEASTELACLNITRRLAAGKSAIDFGLPIFGLPIFGFWIREKATRLPGRVCACERVGGRSRRRVSSHEPLTLPMRPQARYPCGMEARPFQFRLPAVFAAMTAVAVVLVPFVYLSFGAAVALLACIALGAGALIRPGHFMIAASLLALAVGLGSVVQGHSVGGGVLFSSLLLAVASRQKAQKLKDQLNGSVD
ncbi:MAG: hypothetical protein ACREHD_26390 [Pirellulales bacterium]